MRVGFRPPSDHDAENDAVLGASSEPVGEREYDATVQFNERSAKDEVVEVIGMKGVEERVWSRL